MPKFCTLFTVIFTIIQLINCQPSINAIVSSYDVIKTLLINYGDPSILPPNNAEPVNVEINAFILSNPVLLNRGGGAFLAEIDNLWIIQRWQDQRLNFQKLESETQNVTLPYEKIAKIWTPQISAINDKKFEIRQSPWPNVYLSIMSNGTILLSIRPTVQLQCKADCSKNEIRCKLTLECGNYNIQQVRLNWAADEPVFVETNGDQGETTQIWSLNRTVSRKETNTYPLGAYDQLEITFVFKPNVKKCNIEL